jgi:chorismate--pyruvate lyase
MSASTAVAKWFTHVNGVHPSQEMQGWLTDRVSLTVKLISRSNRFRVQRLVQQRAVCLADEYAMVGLSRRRCVQEREVLLCCDGKPVVFAHTVVPLSANASDWPFFSSLGERSLGTTLFGDPLVKRGALQFARLPVRHPLLERAHIAVESAVSSTVEGAVNSATDGAISGQGWESPLFARRCLFRRNKGALLVTEVFLPAINGLHLADDRR